MHYMSNSAGIRASLEKELTMLYDLHLIADAFLAEDEIGRHRGLEESETEGIYSSDDQTKSRH